MAYESLIGKITTTPSVSGLTTPNLKLEPVIQVDSGLRTINVPSTLKKIGVTGDHNAETLQFQIPRYFDGRDLYEHDIVIRYDNGRKEYGEYEVTDKQLVTSDDATSTDDDYIVFSWEISNYVTRYSGTVTFTVQFQTVSEGIQYQWQTMPATLEVMQGIDTSQAITDKDDSLYRDVINRLQDLEVEVAEIKTEIVDTTALKEKVEELETRVKTLEESVVYTYTGDLNTINE